MGIQKVIKPFLLFLVFLLVFTNCNTKSQVVMNKSSCLNAIHINVADTVLLYWAVIAADSTHLINHKGNSRFLISQAGRFYFSYNKNAIANLSNYFNTDLKHYKTLSNTELEGLKDSIQQWNLNSLESVVTDNEINTSGGSVKRYLHTNVEGKVACNQFGMGIPLIERIEKVLKSIQ